MDHKSEKSGSIVLEKLDAGADYHSAHPDAAPAVAGLPPALLKALLDEIDRGEREAIEDVRRRAAARRAELLEACEAHTLAEPEFTTGAAACYLRTSKFSVRRRARSGEFGIRRGGTWFFTEAELLSALRRP